MKYYLVFFKNGFIVDISSYDDQDSWEYHYTKYIQILESGTSNTIDQIQKFSQVN